MLHLELFFRKANDLEARQWLARKQVIAWGIINELSVEIEKLESVTVGDCDRLQALQALMESTKLEHASILQLTTETLEKQAQEQKIAAE